MTMVVESRKRPAPDAPSSLIGVRVGVWWSADATFYNATVIDHNPHDDTHLVRYDDTVQEWLCLRNETCVWRAPRSATAGADAALREALCTLGANNVPACPPPPPRVASLQAPNGRAAVGRTLAIWSPVDGAMHHGEVIAAGKGRLHVLYDDGEDEVVDVTREVVLYDDEDDSDDKGGQTRAQTPVGRDAVGWRVALHDANAMRFYAGVVAAYYASNNTYRIKFDDEHAPKKSAMVSLRSQPPHAVKWLFPLSAAPTASDDAGSQHTHPSPCSSQQTHLPVPGSLAGEHYAVRQLQRLPSLWGRAPALRGPLTVKIACCQGMQSGSEAQCDSKSSM